MAHSAAHPCSHSSRTCVHVQRPPSCHIRTIHFSCTTRSHVSARPAPPAAARPDHLQPPLLSATAAAGPAAASTSQTASSRLRSLSRAPWIAAPLDQPPVARFRFWIDEKRFKGDGDSSLAQAMLLGAGGVRVGGNFKAAAVQGPLGWQVPDQWDLLWSPSDSAAKAAPYLRQGQLISAVPGLRCLTCKQNLSRTLAAAYGPDAWRLIPLTFALPSEVAGWRQELQQEAAQLVETARQQQQVQQGQQPQQQGQMGQQQQQGQDQQQGQQQAQQKQQGEGPTSTGGGPAGSSICNSTPAMASSSSSSSDGGLPSGLWVLKTVEHLGQGLLVVPGRSALRLMLERNQAAIQRQMAAQQALEGASQQQQQQQQQGQEQQQQQQYAEGASQQQQMAEGSPPDTGGQQAPGAVTIGSSSSFSHSSSSRSQPNDVQDPALHTVGSNPNQQQQQQQQQPQRASREEPRPFVAAQRYIANPLLIQGRKFGLRLWCVVMGGPPVRAYLHQLGLVLFSREEYTLEGVRRPDGMVAPGHLTNHAQNKDAPVWSLQQLQQHLGPGPWEQLWAACCDTTARAMAAAVPHCNQAAQEMGLPPDSCFELLGLDFLVDEDHHPWLLEVNATPSLAWDHPDPASAALMAQHKSDMLADLVTLLRLQDRGLGQPAGGLPSSSAPVAAAAATASPPRAGAAAGRESRKEQSQQDTSTAAPTGGAGVLRRSRQQQHLGGPLLDAAKRYYLVQDRSRGEVLQRVMAAASKLAAAQATAPTRQQAEEQLATVMQQAAVGTASSTQTAAAARAADSKPELSLLLQHREQLVGVVAEASSPGGWVCLQDHMPSAAEAQQQGWHIQYADVDMALQDMWARWSP